MKRKVKHASILRVFQRKLNYHKRSRFFQLILIITFLAASSVLLKIIFQPSPGWWRFAAVGRIYYQPAYYKKLVFFGNGYGYFFAIDSRSGKTKWSFKAENGISSPPIIYKDKVFFESYDGTLFSLKAKTGEELWRYSNKDHYTFSSPPVVKNNTVFVSDARGRLFAFDIETGKLNWTFDAIPPTKISSIHNEVILIWKDYIKVKGGVVFFASKDGYLYAVSRKTGSLKWKFDTGSAITTSPEVIGRLIYIGNKNGDSVALNLKNGKPVWQSEGNGSPVSCIKELVSIGEFSNPVDNKINSISNIILKPLYSLKPSLIEVRSGEGVIRRNSKRGNELWRAKIESKSITCPSSWFSYLYFGDMDGRLHAINASDGSEVWKIDVDDKIFITPVLSYNWRKPLSSPMLFYVTLSGKVHAVNALKGRELWKFSTFLQIYGPPIVRGGYLYVGSFDGGLYRIKYYSGKLDKPRKNNKIEVEQSTTKVGDSQIAELTIHHDDAWYTNPWKEVEIVTTFKHESGETIRIYGFYYDKDTWKVRFNPTEKGAWEWQVQFKTPDKVLEEKGQFVSRTDTKDTFIRRSEANPRRLTLDNEYIYNGIGIGSGMLDINSSGSPLDDWTIGDSSTFTFESPFGIKENVPSDKIVDLESYLDTYGAGGDVFNLYRWSVDNWSFPLWVQMTTHNRYLIPEGKYGDTFVQSLKNNNFKVLMTMIANRVFYRDLIFPENRQAIRDYVKYIIARYGAYVDIWEIANEAYVSDAAVKFVADEIRSFDHESRLISMSWERPEMDEIDIISPHWYEAEKLEESDLAMKAEIEKYDEYDKPIIFGEQGNVKRNWDETSALRMRVRSWVAFFEEAILIFWNQSDDKNFYNPIFRNANLFIGEEERRYIRNLQSFTKDAELSAKKIPIKTQNPSVRSYGLLSDKELLGYFYHFEDADEQISFRLALNFPEESEVQWYDPSTGDVVRTQVYSAGSHLLISPEFSSDIALKATFRK